MNNNQRADELIVKYIAAMLYILLVSIVFIQIILRYFGIPLLWVEAFSRYIFIWISFLGAALVFHIEGHINVDILKWLIPTQTLHIITPIIKIINRILIAFLLVVLIVEGINQANLGFDSICPSTSIRLGFVWVSLPIAAAYMLYYYLILIKRWIYNITGERANKKD